MRAYPTEWRSRWWTWSLLFASLATLSGAAGGDAAGRSLVAMEFVDSPPSSFMVAGGLLGVPDSSGLFPAQFRRDDPVSGNWAAPGTGAGNHLLFTDLRPGVYRVALVLLEESAFAKRVLAKRQRQISDQCQVYGDTCRALTFEVRDGQVLYLGRITRKSRPSLEQNQLWRTTLEWSAGDERKAWRAMLKRKDLKPWKDLLKRRLAVMDSLANYRAHE